MEYKLKRKEREESFVPYELILTFETKAESDFFHDKIMGQFMKQSSHPFYGDIYRMGRGEIDSGDGTIDIEA